MQENQQVFIENIDLFLFAGKGRGSRGMAKEV